MAEVGVSLQQAIIQDPGIPFLQACWCVDPLRPWSKIPPAAGPSPPLLPPPYPFSCPFLPRFLKVETL